MYETKVALADSQNICFRFWFLGSSCSLEKDRDHPSLRIGDDANP